MASTSSLLRLHFPRFLCSALEEPALQSLAQDAVLQEAIELARRAHGEGSHHSIAWEARVA